MTPKLNQPPRSPSASYTDAHVRARYSVAGDAYVKKRVTLFARICRYYNLFL